VHNFLLETSFELLMLLFNNWIDSSHLIPRSLTEQFCDVPSQNFVQKSYVFGLNALGFLLKVVPNDSYGLFDNFLMLHPSGSIKFSENFPNVLLLFELGGLGDHLILFLENFFILLTKSLLEL
jgi:hypothetical protein